MDVFEFKVRDSKKRSTVVKNSQYGRISTSQSNFMSVKCHHIPLQQWTRGVINMFKSTEHTTLRVSPHRAETLSVAGTRKQEKSPCLLYNSGGNPKVLL